MEQVFWLEQGRIAGRSGPNMHPWRVEELKAGGIGAVLSVNAGELCDPDRFAEVDIRYRCVPLSDTAPPVTGHVELNLERLPIAYAWIQSCLAEGRTVLIHCQAGKDRTGLMMAYYLTRQRGQSPVEAIANVKQARPIALSAEGWDGLALAVLTAMESTEIPAGPQ
jgi:protein-tyrosine phosphatase